MLVIITTWLPRTTVLAISLKRTTIVQVCALLISMRMAFAMSLKSWAVMTAKRAITIRLQPMQVTIVFMP